MELKTSRQERIRRAARVLQERDRIKNFRVPNVMELNFGGTSTGGQPIRLLKAAGNPTERARQDELHILAYEVFEPFLRNALYEYDMKLRLIADAPIDSELADE